MIPKKDVIKPDPMLSADEAERRSDAGLSNVPPVLSFDLCPIKLETVREVVSRYEAGGWHVEDGNLRMPNGYRVTLS